MTQQEKLDICIRELLFGAAFLTEYRENLERLWNTPQFMQVIDSISEANPEPEFSTDSQSAVFRTFKKSVIGGVFSRENLSGCFPAYGEIERSVKQRGKAAMSAAISVYYAMRYLELCAAQESAQQSAEQEVFCQAQVQMMPDSDYRKKWEPVYRCDDGHYVRSKNEQLVDNWLYYHRICHGYEPMVVDRRDGRDFTSDFYLPQYDLYLEVWGMKTPEYLCRMAQKIEAYQANHLNLLEMTEQEIKNLDDFMRRNLLGR